MSLLRRNLLRSDASLLAYVVMTNHLHLVVIQGEQPLSGLMQPFLRSVALQIHAAYSTQGQVFERRFGDRVCRDPGHLRNAIAYTHANPVRAGMCKEPDDYPWSSHRLYCGDKPMMPPPPTEVTLGLSAFGSGAGRYHVARGRAGYRDQLAGVLSRGGSVEASDPPGGTIGPGEAGPGTTKPSLQEIAEETLALTDKQHTLASIGTRWGGRSRIQARSRIALAASRAGFTGQQIAAFLGVSTATVSRDLAAGRSEP